MALPINPKPPHIHAQSLYTATRQRLSGVGYPVHHIQACEGHGKEYPRHFVDHADAVDPRALGPFHHDLPVAGVALDAAQELLEAGVRGVADGFGRRRPRPGDGRRPAVGMSHVRRYVVVVIHKVLFLWEINMKTYLLSYM